MQLAQHFAHAVWIETWRRRDLRETPVPTPDLIDELEKVEQRTGRRVFNSQLRHHLSLELRQKIAEGNQDTKYDVDLTYITSGRWYMESWKASRRSLRGQTLACISSTCFILFLVIFSLSRYT